MAGSIRSSSDIQSLAVQQSLAKDAPIAIYGTVIGNPGDGKYQLWPASAELSRFRTVTIVQPDPEVPLSGVLKFSLGAYDAEINLAANARFLAMSAPLPFLWLRVEGANRHERWTMVLS